MSPQRPPLSRFWVEDWGLTFLLGFLVLNVFVLGPLHELGFVGRAVVGTVFALVLLSGIGATAHSRLTRVVFGTAAFVAFVVHWANYLDPAHGLNVADACASLFACLLLAGIVLVQTFREGPVTAGRLQGAVVVYLLIGVIYGFAFTVVDLLYPESFDFGGNVRAEHGALNRSLMYFSMITMTTTGYGDIQPLHAAARALASSEAVLGQLYPAVLLARLVSMEIYYRQRRFEREQAALDRQALAREVAKLLKE